MRLRRFHRWHAAAAALVAVSLGAGIAVAAIPGNDGTIHACYGAGGALRVIDAADQCRGGETPLTWSQQGPAGPAGLQGATGPQGAQGAGGPAGAPGVAGPAGAATAIGRFHDATIKMPRASCPDDDCRPDSVFAPGVPNTVRTMTVANGRYLIVAKASVRRVVKPLSHLSIIYAHCRLSAGLDFDEIEIHSAKDRGVAMPITLTVLHTFGAGTLGKGIVGLRCQDETFGVSTSINHIKITAIRLTSYENLAF